MCNRGWTRQQRGKTDENQQSGKNKVKEGAWNGRQRQQQLKRQAYDLKMIGRTKEKATGVANTAEAVAYFV